MTDKPANSGKHTIRQALAFVLCCGYGSACAAIELEPISYREAVDQYRDSGGVENYRCALLPADADYHTVTEASPIAVEIDHVLFIRIAGRLHTLQQSDINNSGARYDAGNINATLTIISQFNFTEYNESDDRHVNLVVEAGGKKTRYNTLGTACGL